jgi:hypothetical protein
MTKLITKNFKTFSAEQFVESVTEPANTAYYLFFGNHVPFPVQDATIPTPTNADKDLNSVAYSTMVGGKRLSAMDINLMIKRNNWEAGKVYDSYNDALDVYENLNFYVNVDEVSYHHVYKCLYNNKNSPSIDPPRFNDTSADDLYYSTSDGYVWKYMYSIDKTTFDKFSTSDYIPVVPNANVVANAVNGTIDLITVESGGQRYDNYYYGKFNSNDLRIGGDTTVYEIGKNASSTNGFYTDCMITIVEGTGKGQYKRVADYKVFGPSKQITVNSQFSVAPDVTSRYEITPLVSVNGNGTQSVNCDARAIINSVASNSVHQIEILNRGAGYLQATASVVASANVGVTNAASLSVVVSPYGGHGFDAAREFSATAVGLSIKLSNSEFDTISVKNDFRTFGIIQDPQFANVNIKIFKDNGVVGSDGAFLDNEGFIQYRPVITSGTVSIDSTSSTLTGTSTDFQNAFETGEKIVVKAGTNHFIATIAGITNSTSITLTSNGGFTNTAASAIKIKQIASGNIVNISAGSLDLTKVEGEIAKGEKIIGLISQATAFVNTASDGIKINNIQKDFDTFSQLHRMEYNSINGEFEEDEVIQQEQNLGVNPTARFHSSNNTFLFTSNKFGIFNNGNTVIGAVSGAEASINAQWPGDLVPGSGKVLYIENFEPITRANTQSETFKIIVEY